MAPRQRLTPDDWKLVGSLVGAFLSCLIPLLVDFGLPLSPAAQVDLMTLFAAGWGLWSGVYAIVTRVRAPVVRTTDDGAVTVVLDNRDGRFTPNGGGSAAGDPPQHGPSIG